MKRKHCRRYKKYFGTIDGVCINYDYCRRYGIVIPSHCGERKDGDSGAQPVKAHGVEPQNKNKEGMNQ